MPPQDQSFLRGLFTGSGSGSSTTAPATFTALFFNANGYSPGTPISSTTLPNGVTQTNLALGPQVGLTDANNEYASPVYSAYTDFGTPAGPGIQAVPGFSGVQGIDQGEQLIAPAGSSDHTTARRSRPDARLRYDVPPDSRISRSTSMVTSLKGSLSPPRRPTASRRQGSVPPCTPAACSSPISRLVSRCRCCPAPVADDADPGPDPGTRAGGRHHGCRGQRHPARHQRQHHRRFEHRRPDPPDHAERAGHGLRRQLRWYTSGAQDSTSFIGSSPSIWILGRRHGALCLRRPGHLAVQDHGRPGRLLQRHADRSGRKPASPRCPL